MPRPLRFLLSVVVMMKEQVPRRSKEQVPQQVPRHRLVGLA
ncbi:MAG: hypothetical protein QF565_03105 [Arenicellales bacterium]|nr:hypothetical protein [Arenicellales bacterium]